MFYLIFLYIYRFLSTCIIAGTGFFSIYFLATNSWGEKIGQAWFEKSAASLNLFQVIMERYLHLGVIWEYVVVPWLLLPIWLAIIIFLIVASIKLWFLRAIFRRGL